MKDSVITAKVAALHHTQNALDEIQGLTIVRPETHEMIKNLLAVRTEFAYEIFRWDQR